MLTQVRQIRIAQHALLRLGVIPLAQHTHGVRMQTDEFGIDHAPVGWSSPGPSAGGESSSPPRSSGTSNSSCSVTLPSIEAAMKPTAHLINVARGGIVDDKALVEALQEKRIAGAGLDVFENEPALDPRFLGLDNVVVTPHICSFTRATRLAMAMLAAENLIAALSGQRPPNLLNPEVWRG